MKDLRTEAHLQTDHLRPIASVVRLPQLTQMMSLSRSSVYLRINEKSDYFDPDFPKPVRLGKKAMGWLQSDINKYLEILEFRSR